MGKNLRKEANCNVRHRTEGKIKRAYIYIYIGPIIKRIG